jgi:hypothetical protein
MMGDRDNNFHSKKPRKERIIEGMRFCFKEDRRNNKGVVQEISQELQWERCAISDMREFLLVVWDIRCKNVLGELG